MTLKLNALDRELTLQGEITEAINDRATTSAGINHLLRASLHQCSARSPRTLKKGKPSEGGFPLPIGKPAADPDACHADGSGAVRHPRREP